MEATPVQNIIPVVPAASAPNNTAPNSAAANDGNASDAAAQTPRGFGALLALQLGGAGKATLKGDATNETVIDDKPLVDPAATAAVTTPIDALAGLNLPALTPLAAPLAAAPAIRAAATASGEPHLAARPAATPVADAILPRASTEKTDTVVHTTEPLVPARSEMTAFAREVAAIQAAGGNHATEQNVHVADTHTPDAGQLAQLQLNSAPLQAPAAPAQAAIAARVGTPDWNTELGQQIVWMVGDKQQVAELHVNPPELGPLDIKLTIDGSQTTAVFTSPHSEVREAVEAALPRLREVLADSGLTLGNASVTADTPRDSQAFANPQQGGRTNERAAADTTAPAAPLRVVRAARGLVDLFA